MRKSKHAKALSKVQSAETDEAKDVSQPEANRLPSKRQRIDAVKSLELKVKPPTHKSEASTTVEESELATAQVLSSISSPASQQSPESAISNIDLDICNLLESKMREVEVAIAKNDLKIKADQELINVRRKASELTEASVKRAKELTARLQAQRVHKSALVCF